MNKNWIKNLLDQIFKSGNPTYFYIGINVLIFTITTIIGIFWFLSGSSSNLIAETIANYAAFPANLSLLPQRFYTLLTYQFFHRDFFHILFNMLTLYWFGTIFLDFLKPRQFHFVYLLGGILGALLYAAAFNLFPVFNLLKTSSILIGASASVLAIAAAAATLVPDYSLRLLFFGAVKLKYILIALIVIDLLSLANNPGGSFAHIGGAIIGFSYVKLLQAGTDLSKIFIKKPKLKVTKNKNYTEKKEIVNQQEIDAILDKISKSGYEKLTTEEKTTLFKASKS